MLILFLMALALTSCLAPVRTKQPFNAVDPINGSEVDPHRVSQLHTVQRGETVYSIGQKHQISLTQLISVNDLKPPYLLRLGQTLKIPLLSSYTVKKGDTLFAIAKTLGMSAASLARRNGLVGQDAHLLHVGQTLLIPPTSVSSLAMTQGSSAPRPANIRANQPPIAISPARPINTPVVRPRRAEQLSTLPIERPNRSTRPSSQRNTRSIELPAPTGRASSTFLRPVAGNIIRGFGVLEGGYHSDGINIAAQRGAPVRAAENGVVVYSGNGMSTLGTLVLIKHAEGYVSAYAHLDSVDVRVGEPIRRGQIVGTVGTTGYVSSPQLHFQLRHGSRVLDPRKVITRTADVS